MAFLITNVKVCKSLFSKGSGLMFRFPKKPFAYIFKFDKPVRSPITMFFVFYPIDIVFLNEKNEVVEIKTNLKPFKNYFPKNNFWVFIELPAGSVDKFVIKKGQIISWSEKSVNFL